jgi:hypothetical protein
VTRVLPIQEFSVGKQLSDVMLDLSPTVFCVPEVNQYNSLAWPIVMEIHWDHPTFKHTGVPGSYVQLLPDGAGCQVKLCKV